MKYQKILKLIIIFLIILVNIIWIFSSIIMIFKGDSFLNVNSSNINELAHFLPDYNLSPNIKSIQYSHGLGDWNLYFHYIMGKTDTMTFNDGENFELRDYIVENGYRGETLGIIYICIAFTLISFCIAYLVNIFINHKNILPKNTYNKI